MLLTKKNVSEKDNAINFKLTRNQKRFRNNLENFFFFVDIGLKSKQNLFVFTECITHQRD